MTTTPTSSGAANLRTAAQAVVDRWDTPLWKDVPATAEYIGRLRAALAAGQATAAQVVVPDGITLSAVAAREIHGMLQEVAALIDAMPVSISEQLQVRHFFRDELGGGMLLMEDALAAAAPAQPAAQQPQQGVAYAELPDALLPEPHFGEGRHLGLAFRSDAYSVAQVQALFASRGQVPAQQPATSAAVVDAGFLRAVITLCNNRGASPESIEGFDSDDRWIADLWRQAEHLIATAPQADSQPAPSPVPASDDCLWNPLPCVHCEQPQGEHFIGRCYGVSGETVYTPRPTPTAQADNKKKDLL